MTAPDASERDQLAEVLGCRFNVWGECQTHNTPAYPPGYDEHYCPTVNGVMDWLAARDAQVRADAWDEGAAYASPHGGGYLRAIYVVNPYRDPTAAALRAVVQATTGTDTEAGDPATNC